MALLFMVLLTYLDNFFVDTSLGFNHLETDSSRTASNELIKSSFDTYQGWSALAINYDVNFEIFVLHLTLELLVLFRRCL